MKSIGAGCQYRYLQSGLLQCMYRSAIPGGSGSKGGVLLAFEPKYALNDNITLGLRAETAITANVDNMNSNEASGNVKGSASYLATGD